MFYPVKNWKVYGLEDSVKASKYPMSVNIDSLTDEVTVGVNARAKCNKGEGHDQFLTGIIVQFDLTLSIKAWTEAERYHFLDFISSQSTMHRITKFDPAKQCNRWVKAQTISLLNDMIKAYNEFPTPDNYLRVLYNVPVGFELTAKMTTNYRQLKTIYSQRKDHRLPEWRAFCNWMAMELPHSDWITGKTPYDGSEPYQDYAMREYGMTKEEYKKTADKLMDKVFGHLDKEENDVHND